MVHDNQSLGTGLLKIAASGMPVVATVHHPITRDRVLDLAAARWWRKPLVHRWYGFAEMQKRVARQIPGPAHRLEPRRPPTSPTTSGYIPTSCTSFRWVSTPSVFAPTLAPRVPGRIIAIASADVPLKGVANLLQAVAKLRTERDVELQLVARLESKGPTEKLIAELGISDIVHISSGLSDAELAGLLASAEIACIPSLYEGFSLPAVEAMASGTPIVASRAGALPEVLGTEGLCAELVTPGDAEELTKVLGDLLDSPERRYRLGVGRTAARRRRCTPGNPLRRRRSSSTNARSTGPAHADRRLRPTRCRSRTPR